MPHDGSETPWKDLCDMSGYNIDVTIWGLKCHVDGHKLSEPHALESTWVLAIKGGRVVEFNGKIVGTIPPTSLLINLYIVETR